MPSTKADNNMQQSLTELSSCVEDAFHFLYPLHEFLRTRRMFEHTGGSQTDVSNRLVHDRRLLDHRSRRVTTPNTDTLYSRAWLSLKDNELLLHTPDFGDRYYSVAFMDCYTDHFAYVGSRTHGSGTHDVVLIGPAADRDDAARRHPGLQVLQTPSNDVWMLVRILVDSTEDLPRVHALQDAMVLSCADPVPAEPVQGSGEEHDVTSFLALCAEGLKRNDTTPIPPAIRSRLNAAGMTPGQTSLFQTLTSEQRDTWQTMFPSLLDGLKRPPRRPAMPHRRPWIIGLPHIGNFGEDYAYRAHVARVGLGALEKAEAAYASCSMDAAGEPLQGGRTYLLSIPTPVPVSAFWSLTLYELDDMGRKFFTENPIGRYAIGDRTPGLAVTDKEMIQIHIGADTPAQCNNWLPAPLAGPFSLTMRYYLPKEEIIQGGYQLPPPQRVD